SRRRPRRADRPAARPSAADRRLLRGRRRAAGKAGRGAAGGERGGPGRGAGAVLTRDPGPRPDDPGTAAGDGGAAARSHRRAGSGRGDNPLITMLARECAQRGIELIAHDKGGAWLFIDRRADPETALAIVRYSLDRRGVCNRLNVLLVHAAVAPDFLPRALPTL